MSCEPTVIVVKEQTIKVIDPCGAYTNSEDVISKLASTDIGGHRVVKSVSATHVDYADNSVLNDSTQVLGLTLSSASGGDRVLIRTWGEVSESSWSWTEGWVWLDHNGLLTQTPPTTPSAFSMIIGQALSATTMRVLLLSPITL